MKKIVKVLLPIVIVFALFLGIKIYTESQYDKGIRNLIINVKVKNESEDFDEVKTVKYKTKNEVKTLGDVLDELNGSGLTLELQGEKESEWGRMIVAIEEYKTEDMNTGPWWMIYSETNKDCEAAGFCSGIDSQSVYEDDVFDLVFE